MSAFLPDGKRPDAGTYWAEVNLPDPDTIPHGITIKVVFSANGKFIRTLYFAYDHPAKNWIMA